MEWGLGMRQVRAGPGENVDDTFVSPLPPCVSQRRPHHPTNSSLEIRTRKLEHKIIRGDQEYDPIRNHEEDNPEVHSPPTAGPPGLFWIG